VKSRAPNTGANAAEGLKAHQSWSPRIAFGSAAAAKAILDQGIDLAGDKVDTGQQADRAVALVLALACEGFMRRVMIVRCLWFFAA
jgi:hypothetical protein